jgi:hypothetical protein
MTDHDTCNLEERPGAVPDVPMPFRKRRVRAWHPADQGSLRIRVILGLVVSISLLMGAWLVYTAYAEHWLRVKTLDTFAVLFAVTDAYVGLHPDASDVDIRNGIVDACASRTGTRPPVDGWGREIILLVAREDSRCLVVLRSAGPDGVMETTDDVVQRMEFHLREHISGTSRAMAASRSAR